MKIVLLVCLSLAVGIFLVEVGLWVAGVNPISPDSNIDGVARFDDHLGWVMGEGFSTEFYGHTVRTNDLGFRGDNWQEGENRILTLGDSFCWGWGVPEDSTYSERVGDALGVEVMNMGVPGYSTDQELLLYRKLGKDFPHKFVILYLGSDDVWYNVINEVLLYLRKPSFVPMPMTEGDTSVTYVLRPPDKLKLYEKAHLWGINNSRLLAMLWFATHQKMSFDGLIYPTDRYNNGLYARTIFLLQQLKREVEDNGAKLLVITFRGRCHWFNSFGDYEEFLNDAWLAGILVVPTDCEELYKPEAMWVDDRHWSSIGHRIVAEKILGAFR